MTILNLLSFAGIFGLCAIAWLFSENRKVIPWRVIFWGIGLQLILGFLVFWFEPTKYILNGFSQLLNGVFVAADDGARFVFGPALIPRIGEAPTPGIGTIFAFRVLPTVIFFGGLMALLYNIGVIQPIINFFAKVFYAAMRLSGAEAMSGAANIFVGIEAAIVIKPFLAKMTRSELAAILACCFGTAASSTLAIYVRALENVFPNILVHLVSASIIAIPACFVLSKILIPETEIPLTAGGIPQEEKRTKVRDTVTQPEEVAQDADQGFPRTRIQDDDEVAEFKAAPTETVGGEPIERVSPVDAAILGAIDGLKMAVTIAAVLILILGLVSLINQSFAALANLKGAESVVLQAIGQFFSIVTLQNILGVLFLPLTALTGVSLEWNELWQASVIIGRRLFETAIPPYQTLGTLGSAGAIDNRTILIVSYALSGFAHLASVGIFVGGMIALIPSRRKDITDLGWKALFVGTLATIMIACVAGVFDTGDYSSILGERKAPAAAPSPSPTPTQLAPIPTPPVASPTVSPTVPIATPPVIPTTPLPQATAVPARPSPTAPVVRPVPQTTAPTASPGATLSPRPPLQPAPTPTTGQPPSPRPQATTP